LSSFREIGSGVSGSVNTAVGEGSGVEAGATVGVASRVKALFSDLGSGGIRVNVARARGAGVRVAVGCGVRGGEDLPKTQLAASRAMSPEMATSLTYFIRRSTKSLATSYHCFNTQEPLH
jgi:hypothetical protein